MKKLFLAAALFIASDAAFAHSSVLSRDDRGTAPALIWHQRTIVVEPPSPGPGPSNAKRHEVKLRDENQSPVVAFFYHLYHYFVD